MSFKLTYASMFNPPEEMHQLFENACSQVKANLGREFGLIIDGEEQWSSDQFSKTTPIDTRVVLAKFQKASVEQANQAVSAAAAAFPAWKATPWQERVALLRKAADNMERRVYEIAAIISLEVGKNRFEALGDIAETIDLFRYACSQMEDNQGFIREMNTENANGLISLNRSTMHPYGVWLVISPFNFPAALAGGPAAAALVCGNTLVLKPALETSWTARCIAECLVEAGLPKGVVNFVSGSGSVTGQALLDNPLISGITFTGSYPVGMNIYRQYAHRKWIHPIVLELGGKNATIVSRNADLDAATTGIIRSAFGLQGQKCSATSRILIEAPVYDALVQKLVAAAQKLTIGDPTLRTNTMGPVANQGGYASYQKYVEQIRTGGKILTGGEVLTRDGMENGYFCAPTLAELPLDHPLWKEEMFLPIATLAKFESLADAMRMANDVEYGLTAGFFGNEEEGQWFFDNIQAGVTYVNRVQGASTGAWPGYQPFGGWKASGATGKNAGGVYYLPVYLREQSRTVVRKES